MRKCLTSVIPSAARDLVFSATYEEEISRLHLEMTIATQSLSGEGRMGAVSCCYCLPPASSSPEAGEEIGCHRRLCFSASGYSDFVFLNLNRMRFRYCRFTANSIEEG